MTGVFNSDQQRQQPPFGLERVRHLEVQYFSSAMPSLTHPGMEPEFLYRWNGTSPPILSPQALKGSGLSASSGMVSGRTQQRESELRASIYGEKSKTMHQIWKW